LDDITTLQQVAPRARRNLSRSVWDYIVGGSETETTLRRNRLALDCLALRPSVLRNVSEVDTSTSFLGAKLAMPVMLAPIGSLQLIHPDGALASAKAAATAGTISFMSSVTLPEREVVGAATDAPKVFQLYVRGDDASIDSEVKRARDAGFDFFCLTVDTAVGSRRERDIIGRWLPPSRSGPLPGREFQTALSWDNVKRFKDTHDIPLIIKGIHTAEDAAIAIEHGVNAVYVSNHGGRQLDHGRGAADILPEVVAEVAGRAPVVFDGGIMRGTDVIKALALGADAVAIGKLQGLGLGAGGEAGVARVLALLQSEITISMGLLGARNVGEITPDCVEEDEPVVLPQVTSPYPMIEFEELEYER
jgi:isopentenyl diphosphate isomerase/L-lactate dehydrogenase-like FMN-dependent dehydrogenase